MPQAAELRRKKGYWYTEEGGQPVYFGRLDEMTYRDARRAFRDHLRTCEETRKPRKRPPSVTVLELCNRYLDWCRDHQSTSVYQSRKSILRFSCNHLVAGPELHGVGQQIGELPAEQVRRKHLEEHVEDRRVVPSKLTGKPVGDVALRHIVVVVKARDGPRRNRKAVKNRRSPRRPAGHPGREAAGELSGVLPRG